MKNIISYSSPPPISWEFLCWWLFILVQKRCSGKVARYGFFSPLLESRFDYQVFLTKEAYKLTTLKWENSHSSSTCLSSKLYLFCILFEAELWCGSLGSRRIKEFSMDKGKGISDPFSMELPGKISKEKLKLGPSSGYGKEKATNDQHLPNLKSLVSDSTKKHKMKKGNSYNPKFDLTAMFEKLAAVRENEKRKKELTLIGFLVGEQKDLPRLYAKLRMEWKPLKGSLIFSTLKRGWFEMTFSNADDVNRVWMNRPYHMFSQLLLLKHWYPGFDPTTESISQLDLWVRLHYLPEEFANRDALETIIEGNLIGSFLKMDPTHNSERWNMFTRFCINTDIEKTLGRGVIVPDEHLNKIKFSLWFDDFSPGCGACGKSGHVFKDCANKYAPIPTLQLTIKKPSSKLAPLEDPDLNPSNNQEWNHVGKGNRIIKPGTNYPIPSNNVYLSERVCVNIIYESEESDDSIQNLLNENEQFDIPPNLIPVAVQIPSSSRMINSADGKDGNSLITHGYQVTMASSSMMKSSADEQGGNNLNIQRDQVKLCAESGIEINLEDQKEREELKCDVQTQENLLQTVEKGELLATEGVIMKNQIFPKHPLGKTPITSPELEDEDFVDEYFEYEHDDLLMDDPAKMNYQANLLPIGQEGAMGHILISDDPPFSEKDLDDFINNEPLELGNIPVAPAESYQSAQQSILSSSSFAMEMRKLEGHQMETSNSNSSKRKNMEGVEDTASSKVKGGKKLKN